MTPFPKDKDLPVGSTIAATVLTAGALHGARPVHVGEAIQKLAEQHASPCDMVILCVAAGSGQAFVEGLMESIGSDPTALVDPTNPR